MSDERRFEKGFFSRNRFPVASRYVQAAGRGRLFAAGAVAALLLVVLFLADAFVGRAATIAGGPLSASHALFGQECSTCHVALDGAPDIKCQSCHQQSGSDLGAYTFARHYLYRSGDVDRSAPVSRELECSSCHREHQGRDAGLQQVADAQCASCHEVDSFSEHPEFEFAAENIPDPANLKFPHVAHVREVMAEQDLVDVEASCLQCHTPRPDGRGFQPISFASSCDGCHLTQSTATPFLPSGGAGASVATLPQIRERTDPDAQWAHFWNAGEFNQRGGEVQKRPVYHADPWVLYNLRKLRQSLYPGAELADLLRTSADVPARDARVLHREAVATLRAQIDALRGDPSPTVQRELRELSALLQEVETMIEQPFAPLDETRFDVGVADRAEAIAAGGANEAAYTAVIDSLTAVCQTCHIVERATIRRVQADQTALVRAEFDHRAHVTHARCLDCHSTIPVREALETGDDPPVDQDRAGIVNMPGIATCRSCHTPRAAPVRCTSCHLFHPDKSHWATLSRQD